MNEINKELFEIPGNAFQEHLELSSNERILFSGKFGKGKTTFIRHFFDNQKEYRLDNEYFPIYISPVNYSIASNEDIIKYIKYDIVLELLKNGIEFENFDIAFKEALPFYIYKHPVKVIGKLISFIPYVGKEFDELYKKGKKLLKEVEEYKNVLKKKSDQGSLEGYLDEIENAKSSLYENDFINKIIDKTIETLKDDKKRKVILVIDDLDRLDPEHIFRILNVFAAHFDKTNIEDNKFGFDKVVVVCDYNNIRNIYKHRYGRDADFNGYIDKFYSNEPFYFLNNQQVSKIVDYFIDKIIFKWNNQQLRLIQFTRNMTNQNAVIPLIKTLVIYDFISLRALLNYTREKYLSTHINVKYNGEDMDMGRGCIIFEGIIVNDLLGSNYRTTDEILLDLENKSPQIEDHANSFDQLLLFLTYPRGNFHKDEQSKIFKLEGKELIFDLKNGRIDNLRCVVNNGMQAVTYSPTSIDYLNLCKVFFGNLYGSSIIH